MNLKYYLRGLGIGIFVTSVLLIFAGSEKKQMSDEEIKRRAIELGMIENTVLSDLKGSENESATELDIDSVKVEVISSESDTQHPSEEDGSAQELTSSENTEQTEADSSNENEGGAANSEPSGNNGNAGTSEMTEEYIVITVNGGDGSGTVSKRVFEAGLVDNAEEFDRFLCANGYDNSIKVGNHEVPKNATWEEIANILCSKS